MLSRIFNSARAFLSNPELPRTINKAPSTIILDETMVRTRNQEIADQEAVAQEEEIQDEEEGDPITVYVPPQHPSSQKSDRKRRKRDDDSAEEEMTPAKRKKALPVRAKDDEEQISKSRPVVEIISKKVKAPVEKPVDFSDDEDNKSEREGITSSEQEDSENEAEHENISEFSPAVDRIERKSRKLRHEIPSSDPRDNESELEDEKEPTPEKTLPKKHKRFGSEENDDTFFSTAPEVVVIEDDEEEDSEDSDDEAPEAVTIKDAAQSAKSKEREAVNAVKEQLSASRKKRKEREDAIKKQQEEKRRKEERVARREAARAAKSKPELDMATNSLEVKPAISSLTTTGSLPNHLPLEYLEDDETPAPKSLILAETTRLISKKTKFRDLVEKAPKDKRVGNTTFRVVKSSNSGLAPRAVSTARNTKEAWLAGMRLGSNGKRVGGERKVMNKGFLKR